MAKRGRKKTKLLLGRGAQQFTRTTQMRLREGAPLPADAEIKDWDKKYDVMKLSPLGVYLKTNKISASAFARAGGFTLRSVQTWAIGESLPEYVAIYEIERLTKGVIPMEVWMGTPQAKSVLARWRKNQPTEVLKHTSELPNAGILSKYTEAKKAKAEAQGEENAGDVDEDTDSESEKADEGESMDDAPGDEH